MHSFELLLIDLGRNGGINMQNKTYWFSVIAAFVAMGVVAAGLSVVAAEQLASIMPISRGEEMLFEWQMAGYLTITLIFCYIYIKGRESGQWQEGAKYGAIFGVMMGGVSMLNYSILPIEMSAMVADMIINIVVYTVGGIVTAVIYKPS